MKNKLKILFALLMLIASCSNPDSQMGNSQSDSQNAVYYWKTEHKNNDKESEFLQKYQINKIYMRFFDVVVKDQKVVPNATISFKDWVSLDYNIVPTIFITPDCLKKDISDLPKLLFYRVGQMCQTHNIALKEIQIDCDWTESSKDIFFDFVEKFYKIINKQNIKLSLTIRLHQLSQDAPKCDYGVLMLYNTGNFRDINCPNPILSYQDCKAYLNKLKDYSLPICVAFPNFRWQLHFKGEKFENILYNEDLNNKSIYKKIDENTYEVIKNHSFKPTFDSQIVQLNISDKILVKNSDINEILKIKEEIQKIRPNALERIIIYDLNEKNLNNLTNQDYEKIFNN